MVQHSLAGSKIDEISTDLYPKTIWTNNIIDSVNEVMLILRDALLFDDTVVSGRQVDRITDINARIIENISKLKQTVISPEGIKRLTALKEARDPFIVVRDRIITLIKNGQKEEAKSLLFNELVPLQKPFFDALYSQLNYQTERMETTSQVAANNGSFAMTLLLLLSVVGIAAWYWY
ncbi:MCP four helix bundle domain-containing protein [Chromatium okenii]|uniref:MCP four helix bundle domain-containing protein n=1 Tax=Chromatium okenii TaxID=61644 RepID=UPI00155997F0|nr:MCP four helix bundle domain-containing protein [Chromatium okenii]